MADEFFNVGDPSAGRFLTPGSVTSSAAPSAAAPSVSFPAPRRKPRKRRASSSLSGSALSRLQADLLAKARPVYRRGTITGAGTRPNTVRLAGSSADVDVYVAYTTATVGAAGGPDVGHDVLVAYPASPTQPVVIYRKL